MCYANPPVRPQHLTTALAGGVTFPFAHTTAYGDITDGLYVMTGNSDTASQDTTAMLMSDMLITVSALVGEFPSSTAGPSSCEFVHPILVWARAL